MSSKKLKKKSLGGTDMNQMKISRSTRVVHSDGSRLPRRQNNSNRDESSVVSSSDVEASPHSSKLTNGYSALKISLQASPRTPESSCSRIDGKRRTLSAYSKPNSISPGQKSSPRTLTRKASLKPLRSSTKMAGARSKKSPLINHSEISQFPDLSVERATCSSTLKDSKFPDTLLGSESNENPVSKVCTFSYCSLHGHRHANAPPLKRYISMRRRSLKNQRNTRSENRATRRERNSGKGKGKKEPLALLVEEVDRELALEASKSNGLGGCGEEDAKIDDSDSGCLAERLVGETSNPPSHIDGNLSQVSDFPIVEHNPAPVKCCSANKELNRTVPQSSDKEETGANALINDEHLEMDSRSVGESKERSGITTGKPYDESLYASPRDLENETTEAKDEKENLEPGDGFFQFPPPKDSELNSTKNIGTQRMQVQLKDQKYVRMWRLMYKHAVKGENGTIENQAPLDNVNKTEQVKGAEVVPESNGSRGLQGFSETYEDTTAENGNAGKQQMELYQNDAVKLVQEAFDEILLPEIQDDQSVTSGVSLDQEPLEQGFNDDGTSSLKEEKTPSKWGGKSELKASKSWSNLRKILVLKRFVKALEKVKKINPREPRYLPLQPDPEAEKVNLRRQTSEERKNAEEWMLDYALQKVISKLDPPQQRRVAMLVKAFETVLPPSDLISSPRLSLAEHSQVNKVQSYISSFVQIGEKTGKETDENEYAGQLQGVVKAELRDPVEFPKLEDVKQEENVPVSESTDKDWNEGQTSGSNFENRNNSKVIRSIDQQDFFSISLEEKDSHKSSDELNSDDIVSTFHEALQDENVQAAPKQIDASLGTEAYNAETLVITSAPIFPLEDAMAASKEENGVNEELPPIEESESRCQNDVAQDTQSEKQSYMRLWTLVYKHMASGIAAKDGAELNDEVDEKRLDNAKTTEGTDVSVSSQSCSEKNEDIDMKDDTADDQKAVLRRNEVIKLIEKAIDDILLPENQDNSADDQATVKQSLVSGFTKCVSTNESSREQEDRKEAEECRVPDFEERATDDITTKEEEEKTSTDPKMPRSWSNLKRMILLKRFIKALENVKKFTPRGPRFLPLEAGPEAEKVNLKHQDTDERKNAEEWMLDYAIQQVVTKLTPARKRKVKLLVEAFETVTPAVRR
ncbi:calmodulin binding protein PICBP-like isoform X2 [Humulus lupulus]|nr:calmodulin binding protein PICBP-like isoform X2 [Humulus lupulus]